MTTQVVSNNGEMVEVSLTLDEATVKELHNFVEMHKDEVQAFKYSFQHCLEYVITRGKAEIERALKTREKSQEKNETIKELMAALGAKNINDLRAKVQSLSR